MEVLCAGLMVCDILVKNVDHHILQQDVTRVQSVQWMTGGDALNVAVNLSKMGFHCGLAGRVGKDPFGEFLLKALMENNVDNTWVQEEDSISTAVSIVLIQDTGERHFLYLPGANECELPDNLTLN